MIAERLPQAKVLDLYAGTGALGLEAVSRGAREVVFVDNQTASLHVLRENIARCAATACSHIVSQDVATFLNARSPRHDESPFDLVFADPPYDIADLAPLLMRLDSSRKVASSGLVVIEHFKKVSLPLEAGCLRQVRQSRYGDTVLTMYRMARPTKADSCA